uniref:Uncharacterized protein n=1 Tax=Anguilla anguilla TaxID=7936 RepID=A0A0E9VXR0_ANGAN
MSPDGVPQSHRRAKHQLQPLGETALLTPAASTSGKWLTLQGISNRDKR